MRENHLPPRFNTGKFNCLYCGVVAHQVWRKLVRDNRPHTGQLDGTPVSTSECAHCNAHTYWHGEDRIIYPDNSPAPPAHPDLPEGCRTVYDEASAIYSRSPRAAAALLRLVVQKLMPTLGEKGDNINTDIKSLVEKGLPPLVQQALDTCRVVGNHSVHPGEIDLNDTPDIAECLFEMINFIVDERIAKPNEIKRIYGKLPESARVAVEKRDGAANAGGS